GGYVGARAGQLRRHLDGGKVDLRQRGDREPPIAEPAAQHHRDAEQRSGDRPVNERRGDAHGGALGAASELRRRLPCAFVPSVFPPPLPALSPVAGGAAGVAAGAPSACATVTARLSASWVNPVVTMRSPVLTPRVITAWVSLCWPTSTALTETVSSG